MTRCPRCHTSMLLDYCESPASGTQRIWKCLGCGREAFLDTQRQAEDDRQREAIVAAGLVPRSALV